MGSIAALIIECAIVSGTILGAGLFLLLLHRSFSQSLSTHPETAEIGTSKLENRTPPQRQKVLTHREAA